MDVIEARQRAASASLLAKQQELEVRRKALVAELSGEAEGTMGRAEAEVELSAVEQLLREVAAALGAVGDGRYGLCERCGREIPAERLEAVPEATRCVACS